MGAIDELDANQSGLGAEEVGVDLVQLVPAQVVVAVAGGSGEVVLRHTVVLEGAQDPLGILGGDSVDMGELLGQLRHGAVAKGADALVYL